MSETVNAQDIYALIRFKNGKTEKRELYLGSSFLSQSSRFIPVYDQVSGITIFDSNGKARNVQY